MNRRIVLTALAAVSLLLPGAAFAQAAPEVESPEKIAAVKAQGDAIIAEAKAADLFVNTTDSATGIEILHPASGMTCRFVPNVENRIIVITQVLPRGEDVACDAPMGRTALTFYASRIPGATLDSELRGAVQAIKGRWGGAKPWKPSGRTQALIGKSEKAMAAQKDTRTAWFLVKDREGPMITRVSVVVVDGWVIKMRATAPEYDGPIVEMLLDLNWLAVVAGAREAKAALPTAATP